jgi:soluble lytic murein transglycosylase
LVDRAEHGRLILVPAGIAPYHRLMLARVALLFVLLLPGLASAAELLSQADKQAYRNAFDHARKGNFKDAHLHAARAKDKTLAKVVLWLELTRPGNPRSFSEIVGFLEANPDWPSPHILRLRAEDAIATLSDGELRAWFERTPPMAPHAKLRYADMLMADGKRDEATKLIRDAWVNGDFGSAEEKNVAQRYGLFLRSEDQVKRLDRLVWDGNDDGAKRQYARVSPDWKEVAEARFRLAGLASDAERQLADVPQKLRNDPGLLYERARYLRRRRTWAGPGAGGTSARWRRAERCRTATRSSPISSPPSTGSMRASPSSRPSSWPAGSRSASSTTRRAPTATSSDSTTRRACRSASPAAPTGPDAPPK